jgi:hypothetical protein
MRSLSAPALVALLSCASGCLKPGFPALHQVRGTVTYDGKPAKGGAIQFKPVGGDSRFVVSGLVMPDGKYALNTAIVGGSERDFRPGAPAGEYAVWYSPLGSGEGEKLGEPIRASMVATVKAGDNDIPVLVIKK